MVKEGQLLWTPSPGFAEGSNVARFMRWLRSERGLGFDDYDALWRWSVADTAAFWASVWDFFEVRSGAPFKAVASEGPMFGTRWFEGSRVNYAEHMLRHARSAGAATALHHESELRAGGRTSWAELAAAVRVMATSLRQLGIGPGDRVVAYLPNIPEAAVAMMATAAIGAVWSSAAPEFGVKTVAERFGQIRPRLMFVADGYRFGGKDFDRRPEIGQIAAALDTLQHVVWLPYLGCGNPPAGLPGLLDWEAVAGGQDPGEAGFRYERVEHDHPLWVVFSSGTTGPPKAIAHSHVGVLLEHLKILSFHVGLGPESTMFFYTTTGWMMWNILLGGLLTGASVVLYDGNPVHPGPETLWRIASGAGATCFGASPTFVQIMQKHGVRPRDRFDVSSLTTVLLSGSPATPETFEWFYENVKPDLWLTSQSGGTEICSGFVGASPTLPVYAGEIQTRLLGMDVHAWNDRGEEVIDEVGELVVTRPFPSMPIFFWNDEGGRRYQESYFSHFPGIWRHGDFLKINKRGGCYIYGRSDSTLNRHGVRIGTAEIYRAIERIDAVRDSLIVCCELPGGAFFMPLFVQLQPGHRLDDTLLSRINSTLRVDCSPRHVPDQVFQVQAIPYTLTGKKMEIPVRRILMGAAPDKVASRDAMMNPEALDWFIDLAREKATA